jgi:hypothetical protein
MLDRVVWCGVGLSPGFSFNASQWGWLSYAQVCPQGMLNPRRLKLFSNLMMNSGGLYYAAAVLAPPGYGPFAAWITGWSNWMVQVTGAPSVDYALSAMILAAASITHPSYVPTNYQTFLLTVFVMCIHGCISSMPTLWIAKFNSVGSTLNIVSLPTPAFQIGSSILIGCIDCSSSSHYHDPSFGHGIRYSS